MTDLITSKTQELEQIQTGLQAFKSRKDELKQLASSAANIDVTDFTDKAAVKQVVEKRKELKSARVKVQNEGKAMRDMIRPITNYIMDSEKELVAILEPEEKRLAGREEWVKAEIERVERERIEAENARIQKRIDSLAQFGYQIDYADVKQMSDETFDKYLEAARVQFEKEQAEKAEQERIQREREENERGEREAEQKRIAEERAELERLRKEQEGREAKIREQQEAIEAEKRRLEKEKQDEIDRKNREAEIRKAQEQAAEDARIKAIEDAKEAERLKAEREEKARIAAERKAARLPDKEKIKAYIEQVKSIPVPEMKTLDGQNVMNTIQELISRFETFATEKVNEL